MDNNLLEPVNTGHMTQDEPVQGIPDKFRDPQTGALRTEALLKSYLALERKLSERTPAPNIPASAEEYCIECQHGLFEADTEINQRLHEKGFSNEQAQAVYDLAAEKMIPLIMDVAAEFQAEREIERLAAHFGGEDKWREMSRQLLAYGKQNLPPEVLKGMASSYEGVMALHQMMKGGNGFSMPRARVEAKGNLTEQDLTGLMRSPKYWREKDPAVVGQVTEGFKRLYGQN